MLNDDDDDIPTLIDHRAPPPPPPVEDEEKEKRVPLTIICGFLGAGKSTLLKRILTERHGYRIAVIMNEFGDTADIESSSTSNPHPASADPSDFLELANGCLCCSIKDSGAAAIEKLMQRKGAFDHILLETTGLADPGPIAATFWQNEEYSSGLGKDIILDGVLCVVDAVFGKAQMEEDRKGEEGEEGESVKQIAQSDIILLNKSDLVTPSALLALEGTIRALNPTAPIHRTVRGDVDLGKIMGVGAFRGVGVSLRETGCGHGERYDHSHGLGHDHEHDGEDCCPPSESAPTHYELRGISSLKIDVPSLNTERLGKMDEWLRSVLWEGVVPAGPNTDTALQSLRTKGLILTTSGARYLIQGVRSMYEMTEVASSGTSSSSLSTPDAPASSTSTPNGPASTTAEEVDGVEIGKLVLIGKGLGEDVRKSLRAVFQ
ncbi:CobW/HypB/UreG, nucleotide-binding domain-containing protein [Pterulicium gracile]|uniref:CobW/HypB/UreG, nucleotide-binding domain-containing protein n=1 Tax=Pterulicium gracile TaxID=1884261 RepID=A0A5C3Q0X3_9AGAR|nr:CobW/HypB/UreG, nucleotide-binding domain-containing protein [Pterula gracilis]